VSEHAVKDLLRIVEVVFVALVLIVAVVRRRR